MSALVSNSGRNVQQLGFCYWSLTLYNDEHFFNPNPLNSLGTKNKTLKLNPDGSLTLYARAKAKSPGKDKESNWLPAPQGQFSLYLRAYWSEQAILDGTWKPPVITRVQQ